MFSWIFRWFQPRTKILIKERGDLITGAIRHGRRHMVVMEAVWCEEGWNVYFRNQNLAILPTKKKTIRFLEEWLLLLAVSKEDYEKTLPRRR